MKPPLAKDWWRKRWAHNLQQRSYLQCYLMGRRKIPLFFVGSSRWTIAVVGNGLYASRTEYRSLSMDDHEKGKLVGRIHGKYVVIHAKKSPKWLRNWAESQQDVYVLPKLDRGTLAAHLMERKLRGGT